MEVTGETETKAQIKLRFKTAAWKDVPKDVDPPILRNISVAVDSSSPATHTAQTYPAMVAKAKPSQSRVARRARSTAREVSESEDGSAGHDSSTEQVPGGAPSSVLPRRLLALIHTDRIAVNIYSKANVIGSIVASLRGSPAMDTLLASATAKIRRVKRSLLLEFTVLPLFFACLKLSVHFTVIPDAERLVLVDEAEDSQVTSLVHKLLCGETFKTEDFPGGDRSFCPKLEVREAGEEGDPPCSERCTHENLKRWMSKRFEKLENKLEELQTMNCRSLGMPEGSNHISRKRKASDDPQLRQTSSPDSIGIQTEGPNRKGKKRKTVVTRPDEKKHCLGVDLDAETTCQWEPEETTQLHHRERQDGQQQETQSNVLVLYGDVLDVEPESYVLPPEIPSTFQYEVGSPVAWEKTNPNCYTSVGSVRSFHPSWNERPSSKSKETSAPKGGEDAQQQENESVTARTPPPVENDAAQVTDFIQRTGTDNAGECGQEDHDGCEQVPKSAETLEKVPSPMADVEAIVKEINSEFPTTEEDERYDSCKDDMSTDSQIQENRGLSKSVPVTLSAMASSLK
ncbi:hypothetical protein Bca52824_024222 [Brassica carinata]|uniref:Uncharacterized protein n=1 Tax=Brassica carinata TaxID=52824 RepID=A0A8X7VJT4_BRACI|nr:hypothetical protein Bca52824_024222 [Brassica carinata]